MAETAVRLVPDTSEHLAKATLNERVARSIQSVGSPGFVEWAVTTAFYSALHYVQAYLSNIDVHPMSHWKRDDEIARNPILGPIYRDYRRLKDMSRTARYEMRKFTPDDYLSAASRLKNIRDLVLNAI